MRQIIYLSIISLEKCQAFKPFLRIKAQCIKKNPTRCNSVSKCIIPYLYEAQHVSGDTPPIIRSLKLY